MSRVPVEPPRQVARPKQQLVGHRLGGRAVAADGAAAVDQQRQLRSIARPSQQEKISLLDLEAAASGGRAKQ
jgi:hypothetical protein